MPMSVAFAIALAEARSCLADLADAATDFDESVHFEHLLLELDGLHKDDYPALTSVDGVRSKLLKRLERAVEQLIDLGADGLHLKILLAEAWLGASCRLGSDPRNAPIEGRLEVDLFKIQNDLIADRSAQAWCRIKIAGPSFHYRWTYRSGQDGDFSNIIGEHKSHAVCREEPSLTMSRGMDVHDWQDSRELQFEWAKDFVDKTVRPFWADFFGNGVLIDRVELCRIDGGHGTIPLPRYGLEVSDFEVAVAYLAHDLEDSQTDDHPGRYLDAIGVKTVPDRDRQGAGSHRP